MPKVRLSGMWLSRPKTQLLQMRSPAMSTPRLQSSKAATSCWRRSRKFGQRGYTALDTMTPFPVHGMDQAIGLNHSRLGWLVLALGATGAGCALLLQWWTGAVDYPLNIGGKPLFAIEFAMPITFELLVLFAAFACVFGMLAWNGLPRLFHPAFNYSQFHRASNDRFLLVIEKEDPLFDSETSADMLRELGGTNVELVEP